MPQQLNQGIDIPRSPNERLIWSCSRYIVMTKNMIMHFQYCSAALCKTKPIWRPRRLAIHGIYVSIVCLLLPAFAAADEIDRFPVQPTEQQYQQAVQQLETIGFRPSREERALFVSKPEVSDTQLAKIPNLAFSFGLTLAAVPVTDAGVKSLSSLGNLTTLNLHYTRFTGEQSCGFENLTSLRELRLLGSPVTDKGLLEVAKLKNLRTLDLQKTKVDGPSLEQLSELTRLSTMELDLTDAMFPPLRKAGLLHTLPYAFAKDDIDAHSDDEIETLNLNGFYGIEISDASLPEFASLPNLKTLTLIGSSDVTDDGLAALSQYPELRTLNLEETKVTDGGLKRLAAVEKLSELVLDQTAVTDPGLERLVAIKTLKVLSLNRTAVSDKGIRTLTQLSGLTELRMSSTSVALIDVSEFAQMKNLSTLVLNGSKVNDAGLKQVSQVKSLTSLDLILCDITDAGLKELSQLSNLETLYLNRTQITDDGLKELSRLNRLTTLNLSATSVSDVGMKNLSAIKCLRTLMLFGTSVTSEGVAELQNELPNCEILR